MNKVLNSLVWFFCSIASFAWAGDEIVVHLTTNSKLLPIYLSDIENEGSSFDSSYLKKVNEVQRIVQRNSSIYTRDLVGSLIEKIRMLQKQKKFLQTKLREATNESKNIDS